MFYLVHTDAKHIQEVTFYVAINNGSVLLSCVTTLTLGLIQPCTRLDYLLLRANLITSSTDHPKKTKSQITVHIAKTDSKVSNQNVWFPSSLQIRNKFLPIILIFLMILDTYLVHHTIFRWILVSHQSKLLLNTPCTFERGFQEGD